MLAAAIAIPRLGVGEEAVGVLAVAPPPGPSPGLVEVTIQLRHALAERLPGVLLGQRLRERMKPDGAWLSPADVDRTLASAVRARVEGDYEGAKKMLSDLGVIRPILKRALDRLRTIPTDIEPIFVTAEELAPSSPAKSTGAVPAKPKGVKKKRR